MKNRKCNTKNRKIRRCVCTRSQRKDKEWEATLAKYEMEYSLYIAHQGQCQTLISIGIAAVIALFAIFGSFVVDTYREGNGIAWLYGAAFSALNLITEIVCGSLLNYTKRLLETERKKLKCYEKEFLHIDNSFERDLDEDGILVPIKKTQWVLGVCVLISALFLIISLYKGLH